VRTLVGGQSAISSVILAALGGRSCPDGATSREMARRAVVRGSGAIRYRGVSAASGIARSAGTGAKAAATSAWSALQRRVRRAAVPRAHRRVGTDERDELVLVYSGGGRRTIPTGDAPPERGRQAHRLDPGDRLDRGRRRPRAARCRLTGCSTEPRGPRSEITIPPPPLSGNQPSS
jgi:hypothetical protein